MTAEPRDPFEALAAELAARDASLSHRGDGVFGAMFVAALAAAIPASASLDAAVEAALALDQRLNAITTPIYQTTSFTFDNTQHGADLFIKENDKKKLGKEKIPSKIFEIEQQFLIKRKSP